MKFKNLNTIKLLLKEISTRVFKKIKKLKLCTVTGPWDL